MLNEKIAALNAQLEQEVAAVQNKEQLAAFWQAYLGKKGAYSGLMTELRNVPAEERPAAGKVINEAKKWAEAQYQELSDLKQKSKGGRTFVTCEMN
ncbi:MAG: hypothetical protein IIX68_06975 [Clostridia bacterium]|nr:hypothetical protein [Clostridia bacterium]